MREKESQARGEGGGGKGGRGICDVIALTFRAYVSGCMEIHCFRDDRQQKYFCATH